VIFDKGRALERRLPYNPFVETNSARELPIRRLRLCSVRGARYQIDVSYRQRKEESCRFCFA
jgi:hypothetical protein